jgi:hypothetical protein
MLKNTKELKVGEKTQSIGGKKTKKASVTEPLEEYIQRKKQLQIISLFGKVEYDPKYDYKKTRTRKGKLSRGKC